MIRILLTVLILNISFLTFSQVITGTVKDRESGEPIGFASLFFDGTFAGTTTDEMGQFELDVTKYKSRPLIISAIGYFSGELTEFSSEKPFLVLLNPRIFEIEEVSVSAKSVLKRRKECMGIFRKEFIGRTVNARRCYILNEEDGFFDPAALRWGGNMSIQRIADWLPYEYLLPQE